MNESEKPAAPKENTSNSSNNDNTGTPSAEPNRGRIEFNDDIRLFGGIKAEKPSTASRDSAENNASEKD
jgi:hypothetical protein